MTREEAIESLRGILTEAVEFENSVCYVTEEDREPLEMAIQALEQESCENWCGVPSDEMTLEQARQAVKNLRKKLIEHLDQGSCTDAISRQAVLDKKELVELEDGQSFYCISPEDVETLPPVTPQPKWIPVSERLPEQDKTGCSNWHSVKVFAQIKSNINDVWETEIVKGYFIEFDNEMAFSLEEFPLCIPDGWDFIPLDKDNRAYDEYSERYVELQAWMPLPAPYESYESEDKG